jgi:hypothetical protein
MQRVNTESGRAVLHSRRNETASAKGKKGLPMLITSAVEAFVSFPQAGHTAAT